MKLARRRAAVPSLEDLKLWARAIGNEYQFDSGYTVEQDANQSVHVYSEGREIAVSTKNILIVRGDDDPQFPSEFTRRCSEFEISIESIEEAFSCTLQTVRIQKLGSDGSRLFKLMGPHGFSYSDWQTQ